VERFNLTKLSEFENRKQYHIKISNRFANVQNLHVNKDINRAWETIQENIKISAKESLGLYELKQCITWLVNNVHDF
jgi:50S ribosomal subunit-associated GTPase HflX